MEVRLQLFDHSTIASPPALSSRGVRRSGQDGIGELQMVPTLKEKWKMIRFCVDGCLIRHSTHSSFSRFSPLTTERCTHTYTYIYLTHVSHLHHRKETERERGSSSPSPPLIPTSTAVIIIRGEVHQERGSKTRHTKRTRRNNGIAWSIDADTYGEGHTYTHTHTPHPLLLNLSTRASQYRHI